jgi:hypothetical protein
MQLGGLSVNDEDGGADEGDDLLEGDWTGRCYEAALRWVREADDPDWMVVHGTVLSAKAGKRIEHAGASGATS